MSEENNPSEELPVDDEVEELCDNDLENLAGGWAQGNSGNSESDG